MINMDALRAGIIYQIGMEIWKERRKEASDILPSLTHSSKNWNTNFWPFTRCLRIQNFLKKNFIANFSIY